ncbi:hypothetical protein ACTFIZ_007628 [Dictyostelium cf. discoideum]
MLNDPRFSTDRPVDIAKILDCSPQYVSKIKAKIENKTLGLKKRTLTDDEMNNLANTIRERQKKNNPMNKKAIKVEAAKILRERHVFPGNTKYGKYMISDTQYRNFRAKFPLLRNRRAQKTSVERTNVDSQQVIDWPIYMTKLIKDNNIELSRIINIDETNISWDERNFKFVVDFSIGGAKVIGKSPKSHVTLIGAIKADGYPLTPLLIVKVPEKSVNHTIASGKFGLVFNQSDWVDTEIKAHYIELLNKQINKGVEPGKEMKTLLLADNHSSNLQTTVSELAKKYNIEIFTFPSNSTHLLQPLDLQIFKVFKDRLNKMVIDFNNDNASDIQSSQIPLDTLCLIIKSAYQSATCKINVLSAWKASGIDWESIKQHREANKDKQIIPLDQTSLVLPGCELPNNVCTLANNRQVGVHVTSEDSINKFKITDTKKSTRGRNPKVLNQVNLVQNFIQNVETMNLLQNSTVPGGIVQNLNPQQPQQQQQQQRQQQKQQQLLKTQKE